MERLRLRVGEYELEVEGERAFIEQQLAAFDERVAGGIRGASPSGQSLPRKGAHGPEGRGLSPAEFYKDRKPDSGTNMLVVLGTYLRDYRGQSNFKRADINSLCEEIRIKHVHGQFYTLAVQQGLLMSTDSGYSVTLSGDERMDRIGKALETQVASAVS